MARATRSSVAVEHDLHQQKKRKRPDDLHNTDHDPPPPAKLHRTLSPSRPAFLPPDHALKILHVLRRTDTQGLLDRVFPLPADSASPQHSSSLSSLLQHPAQYPLSVIRDAVLHLRPISSLPRSRVSSTAAQQLHFCNLALDLLHQASRHSLATSLDPESLLASPQSPPSFPNSPTRSPTRKYALVQHLPSGDYWSSVNSESSTPDLSRRITDLSTAHAELAVVLPTPSTPFSPSTVPTLASYHTASLGPKKLLPSQRRLTAAKFLDYGPWFSFAPAYDHDMELVGRRDLGLIVFQKEQRRREYEAARREALEGSGSIVQVDHFEDASIDPSLTDARTDRPEPDLHGLLSEDEAASFKAVLGNWELEQSVQSLLDKNHRALARLEELQFQRLSKEGGGTTVAEEGSEEWETAHSILESLTVLSALRPRAANGEPSTIFPPPSVIRRLHRSLALEPSAGWYGTLPATRAVALCDDSTIKARSTPTPAGPSVATPPPDVASTTTPTPVTQPYTMYPYTYASAQTTGTPYRASSVASTPYAYKPGQAGSFYSGYMPAAGQQQSSYYGQQSYTGAAAAAAASGTQPYMAANQQPYAAAYTNWYAAQYPAQVTAATAAAGTPARATPQPASAYPGYFNGTGGTATPPPAVSRTPAVANTVAANKVAPPQTTATWPYGQTAQPSSAATPTLPVHLKSAQPGSVPQAYSPAVTTAPVAQPQYYGHYQAQPSTPATPAAR